MSVLTVSRCQCSFCRCCCCLVFFYFLFRFSFFFFFFLFVCLLVCLPFFLVCLFVALVLFVCSTFCLFACLVGWSFVFMFCFFKPFWVLGDKMYTLHNKTAYLSTAVISRIFQFRRIALQQNFPCVYINNYAELKNTAHFA